MWFLLLAACGWLPGPRLNIDELPVDPNLQGSGNVLVLLIDDIGVNKVSGYGASYTAHTPNIDALATQGVRFNNAYAAPLCSPARAMLMTGRHARRTGIGTITERKSNGTRLPLEAVTIPEALQHAPGPAWSNGAIGKWHLAGPKVHDWPLHPNQQGFDHFAGGRGNPQYKPDRGYAKWSRNVNGVVADSTTYLTTGTVDDALALLEGLPEPWFVYVAFNSAHVPIHDPPRRLLSKPLPRRPTTPERHDAMIEALDTEIGRLITSIDPGALSRTTLITLGDNGTARFGLKKGDGPPRTRIKHSVYQGGVRIPMIVNGPMVRHPGSTEDALVSILDIFPTVLELAGVDPTSLPVDGISILPLLAGEQGGHETIYAERFEPNGPGPYTMDRRSLRNRTHELIRHENYEHFFRIDGWWEGSDNLLEIGMNPTDEAAFATLTAEMDRLAADLVYEGR